VKKSITIYIALPFLLLISCVTGTEGSVSQEKEIQTDNRDYPSWFTEPPVEEGYLFGIGISDDLDKAKQKSIVDIAYQMSVHVESSLYDRAKEDNGSLTEQVTRIGSQVSRSTVVGTKFYDQYESADGDYYVLSRSPLECTMGAIESLLISYRLELEDIGIEIEKVQELIDEKIDFYRNDLQVEWLIHKPVYTFPEMVAVEGGTFFRGSGSKSAAGVDKENEVILSSFKIGKYEITQKEWFDVMGFTLAMQRDRADSNWEFFGEGDDYPMYYVSFADIATFCNKLSIRGGFDPCYTIRGNFVSCDFTKNGFRLPTEAEWEYAAWGGAENPEQSEQAYESLDFYGWSIDNSGGSAHPVAMKRPNPLGIYDMKGNVWEFVWDWYGFFDKGVVYDPTGPASGDVKVLRGGSWAFQRWQLSETDRYTINPAGRQKDVGFRVARNDD